jgi:hypothetical protein
MQIDEARLQYSPAADGSGRMVPNINGKRLTLKALHNMRVLRDRRDAELAAQRELVKVMYGPRPTDDEQKPAGKRGKARRALDRPRKPAPSAPGHDVVQNDNPD